MDDGDKLKANLAQLQGLLDTRPDLSPEARVTGLAALVTAETTLRLLDAAEMRVNTLRDDIAGPLGHALLMFSGAAPGLEAGLRRLQER